MIWLWDNQIIMFLHTSLISSYELLNELGHISILYLSLTYRPYLRLISKPQQCQIEFWNWWLVGYPKRESPLWVVYHFYIEGGGVCHGIPCTLCDCQYINQSVSKLVYIGHKLFWGWGIMHRFFWNNKAANSNQTWFCGSPFTFFT